MFFVLLGCCDCFFVLCIVCVGGCLRCCCVCLVY